MRQRLSILLGFCLLPQSTESISIAESIDNGVYLKFDINYNQQDAAMGNGGTVAGEVTFADDSGDDLTFLIDNFDEDEGVGTR